MVFLTRQERQVLLFLCILLFTGTGLNFLLKRYAFVRSILSIDSEMGKLDLNYADKEALCGLPGIGETLAQRIIAYRISHGGFRQVSDLRNIKGITAYRYEQLQEYVYVKASQ